MKFGIISIVFALVASVIAIPKPTCKLCTANKFNANGTYDLAAIPGVRPRVVSQCLEPGTFALTFDDGVNLYESQILDKLKAHNVKITFFLAPNMYKNASVDPYPSWIRRMYNEGHQVATHTFTHPNLVDITTAERIAQLTNADRVIKSIIGKRPAFMRPPYGSYNDSVLKDLADYGIQTVVLWNALTMDFAHNNATQSMDYVKQAIETNCPEKGSSNIILLAHSPLSSVLDFVDLVIPYVKSRGYRFVRLDECVGGKAYRKD
ncbi:hypothetical protein HK096_009389 [Nowakowskiella sp. JEL0078]|nr:hypothetical protein HK096_009389 [Nowakowskiella sp. JEL0078]